MEGRGREPSPVINLVRALCSAQAFTRLVRLIFRGHSVSVNAAPTLHWHLGFFARSREGAFAARSGFRIQGLGFRV